jgi:outer membrane protein TolC
MSRRVAALTACLVVLGPTIRAQSGPLTLDQAVHQALDRYPAVRGSIEQVSAAAAAIQLARTAYLPRADFLGQLNRATHNNVFGLVLPQTVLPSISGPVLGTNSMSSVWGSAVGVLVSWEPFDFGLRRANVDVAAAGRGRAAAEADVTRLQVGAAAADAFLTLLAAQQTAVAARAAVDRSEVLDRVVETLAKAQLRPGADASRSRAELAIARTQQAQAEQAIAVARAALGQLLGLSPGDITTQGGALLKPPSDLNPSTEPVTRHPLAVARAAATAEVASRERALERTYFPRIYLQGSSYARGTGVDATGSTGGAASGLGPNIQNWALGAVVSFPSLDLFSIRARKEIELHNERSAQARYEQTIQDLNGDLAKAKAALEGAIAIARNTPIQLEAARDTEQQASARYKSGLGNIIEVAEAQRLLTQSEIDNGLAQLGVWRALLGIAAAEGDIAPFIAIASK